MVWDRLPMTIVFMALVAAMITGRISVPTGFALLPFLLLVGIASVARWSFSEVSGAGDLRFYGVLQAYAIKHLTAAAAGWWILRMLEKRRPLAQPQYS